MYINKVQIVGNLTKDPEIKALPSGSNVCNFSVATNRSWKDKDGQKQEEVEFHNVTAFGKQADVIHQYMTKGSQIYVEGRLKTRSWETQSGEKRYATDIVLENFQFGRSSEKKDEQTPQEQPKAQTLSPEEEYAQYGM